MSTRSAPNVPVLMYHHVTPAGGMIAATPDVFEDQIARLARAGYQSLSADQFAACLAGAPVPERSVLITFDDGYLNNWVHAHPVLARHGMRRPVHHHRLDRRRPRPAACGAGRPAARHAGPRRLQAAGRRRPRRRGHAALERDRGHARRRHVRIHSHTHTHTRWDKECAGDVQAKRARIADELRLSREARWPAAWAASATTCAGRRVISDADYVAAAREAGFRHLYTTDPFGQNTPGADPEHIYRFAVRNRGGSWLNRRIWLSRDPFWGPRYHAWKAWKKRLRNRG